MYSESFGGMPALKHVGRRYPFLACEVFTCEIDVLFSALLDDYEVRHLTFAFVQCTRASQIRAVD